MIATKTHRKNHKASTSIDSIWYR